MALQHERDVAPVVYTAILRLISYRRRPLSPVNPNGASVGK